MSAKHDDWARLQEIYDVVRETRIQMEQIGFTKERFLDPENAQDDLISEGLMNRVFRVTEEAGHLSDEVARRYGFDRQGVLGVRNRLAHAYGEVDREIIWSVIEEDFDELLDACRRYCADNDIELE